MEEHVKLSDAEAQERVSKNCRVVHHDCEKCDQEAFMLQKLYDASIAFLRRRDSTTPSAMHF